MIERIIHLPPKSSFFLFGPRQTGKSTLIQSKFTKSFWSVDLLETETFFAYSKDPSLFRREALRRIKEDGIRSICIDEVQRVPLLLNEVQILLQSTPCRFILTGSSARKLRRGEANLLGGRAVERHLFPFVYEEIKSAFDLETALRFGTLPAVWDKNTEEKRDILNAYVHSYLAEEIKSEGIVRNLGGFSKFLDLAASQFGEQVNFSSIARECQLPIRSVQSYYEVLEDTLVGFRLQPWRKSLRKRLALHPKFYFFDLGVINAVNKQLTGALSRDVQGKLFEHFIVLEIYRQIHYRQSEANMYCWRTNHGAEVDLLIEKHGTIRGAFEIKLSSSIAGAHLSGLRAFRDEYPKVRGEVICTTQHGYEIDRVKITPWFKFLERLGDLI